MTTALKRFLFFNILLLPFLFFDQALTVETDNTNCEQKLVEISQKTFKTVAASLVGNDYSSQSHNFYQMLEVLYDLKLLDTWQVKEKKFFDFGHFKNPSVDSSSETDVFIKTSFNLARFVSSMIDSNYGMSFPNRDFNLSFDIAAYYYQSILESVYPKFEYQFNLVLETFFNPSLIDASKWDRYYLPGLMGPLRLIFSVYEKYNIEVDPFLVENFNSIFKKQFLPEIIQPPKFYRGVSVSELTSFLDHAKRIGFFDKLDMIIINKQFLDGRYAIYNNLLDSVLDLKDQRSRPERIIEVFDAFNLVVDIPELSMKKIVKMYNESWDLYLQIMQSVAKSKGQEIVLATKAAMKAFHKALEQLSSVNRKGEGDEIDELIESIASSLKLVLRNDEFQNGLNVERNNKGHPLYTFGIVLDAYKSILSSQKHTSNYNSASLKSEALNSLLANLDALTMESDRAYAMPLGIEKIFSSFSPRSTSPNFRVD